jgi:hypothetical protein
MKDEDLKLYIAVEYAWVWKAWNSVERRRPDCTVSTHVLSWEKLGLLHALLLVARVKKVVNVHIDVEKH